MGCFECRSIVDPVTGHGYHLIPPLQRLHNTQFLAWHNPGKNVNVAYAQVKPCIVEAVKFRTGHDRPAASKADVACYGHGRSRVITGDHDNPYPCPATLLYGFGNSGTHRVG